MFGNMGLMGKLAPLLTNPSPDKMEKAAREFMPNVMCVTDYMKVAAEMAESAAKLNGMCVALLTEAVTQGKDVSPEDLARVVALADSAYNAGEPCAALLGITDGNQS